MSDEGDIPPVDFSRYEKRRFHDSKGQEIAVFDGLVDKEDLDALRLFLLQYNSVYQYQAYDGRDEEHDNVSWIAALKVFMFMITIILILFFTGIPISQTPRGVLWISSDRDDRMGVKIKTQKNPMPNF